MAKVKLQEWELLGERVRQVIAQGRLGTLAFARCSVVVPASRRETEGWLEAVVKLVGQWFAAEPESVHTAGGAEGHAAALARWSGGQGALLTVAPAGSEGSLKIDLILLGSRGALYYRTPDLSEGGR